MHASNSEQYVIASSRLPHHEWWGAEGSLTQRIDMYTQIFTRLMYILMGLGIIWVTHTSSVHAYGVGWCHYFGGADNPSVEYIYPGSSLTWAKVEPAQGRYDFSALDSMIQQARAVGKKLHVQFLVSNPNIDSDRMAVVPQWAVDSGMHVVTSSGGAVKMPIQWDPLYMRYHEDLLRAFAQRYEKPEYYDVIETVIMQSGGNWGEMALPVKNAASLPNADVLDPANYFVQEIARVYLGSESRSGEVARKVGNNFVFDDYFIRAVNELIDLYARTLTHYPFAIQLGNGLSWQQRVAQEPVEYGLSRYGSRMWLRSAAWGSFNAGNSDPQTQDFWGRYQDRTVLAYEPGHPSWWCGADAGYTKGGCYDCCQWNTKAEADQHNTNYINMAINSGAVASCFQSVFFTNSAKYNIDFGRLSAGLQANVQRRSHLLNGVVPTQRPQPTPQTATRTPTPTLPPGSTLYTSPTATALSPTPIVSGVQPTEVIVTTDEPINPTIGIQFFPIQVNKATLPSMEGLLCKETPLRSALKKTLELPEKIVFLVRGVDVSLESVVLNMWNTWTQGRLRK